MNTHTRTQPATTGGPTSELAAWARFGATVATYSDYLSEAPGYNDDDPDCAERQRDTADAILALLDAGQPATTGGPELNETHLALAARYPHLDYDPVAELNAASDEINNTHAELECHADHAPPRDRHLPLWRRVDATIDSLRIAHDELRAERKALAAEVAVLRTRNRDLEAELTNTRDAYQRMRAGHKAELATMRTERRVLLDRLIDMVRDGMH